MDFLADLHIHSKYSRATSKDSDLEHTELWARKKGLSVVGTGDFTHPEWFNQLNEKLEPAEPGLFELKDEYCLEESENLNFTSTRKVRFMLQVEISTIYKKGEKTRKIHHLVLAPSLESARSFNDQLDRIGNLEADGRPILGLDSEDLLEITLESGEDCFLIPAHIWTPWFSLFGSKSGFDDLQNCYGELSDHIFALETGLSSDPPMNWKVSALDDYTLVSNSDAHSPWKMGREASLFGTDLNFYKMKQAMRTGTGYHGTVEFFPEEGKYHLDGHRKCEIRLDPGTTKKLVGTCPECGKDLTVGVLHRVHDLADRDGDSPPPSANPYHSLIPLREVISEIEDVGPKTKTVNRIYQRLVKDIGPELFVLKDAPMERIDQFDRPLLTEAIRRMRDGSVIKEAGYDGEYGTIKLFTDDELKQGVQAGLLFDLNDEQNDSGDESKENLLPEEEIKDIRESYSDSSNTDSNIQEVESAETDISILDSLDEDQRRAVETVDRSLLILAGPGTGKTRTLTHRIAHLIRNRNVSPEQCLAITFSRRAANEMRERLDGLLNKQIPKKNVNTFHGLCHQILRNHTNHLPVNDDFEVIATEQQLEIAKSELSLNDSEAQQVINRGYEVEESLIDRYKETLRERNYLDFDDLIEESIQLLENESSIRKKLQEQYKWISVDEFQDIDSQQYRLLKLICSKDSNVCVIGDPDQSIYGFRGSNTSLFEQFENDFDDVRTIQLSRNYRSIRPIVEGAKQAIEPDSQVRNRSLRAIQDDTSRIEIRECPTEDSEAEFVVKSIERLVGGTSFFSLDSSRVGSADGQELSFSDVGVLYRTNQQAEPLQEAFSRSGIPFQIHDHQRITERPFVKSLLEKLADQETVDSLPDYISTFVQSYNCEKSEVSAERLVEALMPVAERSETIREFRSELVLARDIDLWDPRADRVSLLTLHASKGLEFPVVFIVGCEDELLPLHWGSKADIDLAEERRLFFVGMTRAESKLVLTHAQKRTMQGQERKRQRSPFLHDIESGLLEEKEQELQSKRRGNEDQQIELL